MAVLEPTELARLEQLALATRTRLLGSFTGEHRSRRTGSSLDFADYREYRPGDDFRSIDPAVSARTDRLYLKLYEAEEDVPVRIVLDASASMGFGRPAKLVLARRLAAAFAHVSLLEGDRARLYVVGDGGVQASRWFHGKGDTFAAMDALDGVDAGGPSLLRAAIGRIREEGRAGILVLVSDLLDVRWEETVRRVAPPGEAVVAHVLAPEEMEPTIEGDLTLVDSESGEEVDVSVTADMLEGYRRRLTDWLTTVRSSCTSRGTGYVFARSDASLLDLFVRALRRAQVIRG